MSGSQQGHQGNQTTFLSAGQLLGTNTVGTVLNYNNLLTPTHLEGEYNTNIGGFGEDILPMGSQPSGFDSERVMMAALNASYNEINKNIPSNDKDLTSKLYLLRDSITSYMNNKNISIFSFLVKPVEESEIFKATLELMFMFDNKSYNSAEPLSQFATDTSMEETKAWLSTSIGSVGEEKECIQIIKKSVGKIVDLWLETMKSLTNAEDTLNTKLKNIEKVQKSLAVLQVLPVNNSLPPLLEEVKKYLEVSYRENALDKAFEDVLKFYKRMVALQDIMKVFRFANSCQDNDNLPVCPVCIERPVNMCLAPCGHTFCDTCTGRDMRFSCPVCRTTIKSKQKLFFT